MGILKMLDLFQLADGMTIHVTTVNLMLETRGGRSSTEGGATW